MRSNDIVAERSSEELLQELLDDLHKDDEQGHIIDRLLDSGADIAVRTRQSQTLLHLAVGSATRVQCLLKRGTGVLGIETCDQSGRTALHYAAATGNPRALHVLLAHGADVSAKDPTGASVLHLGIRSPHTVKFALEQGISANATDSLGRTPMHYLFMLDRRSKHEHRNFTSPRRAMMIDKYAREMVIQFLEKAGHQILRDSKGLRPPLTDPFELDSTARWIDENEYRYRLQTEIILHYFSQSKILLGELIGNHVQDYFENKLEEEYGTEPRWRIIPDEIFASLNERD